MLGSLVLKVLATAAFACSSGTAPSAALVGTWEYREEMRSGVYDVRHKRWGLPFAKTASYTFRADGQYDFHRSLTSSTGTGNLELSWSTTGSYVVRGELLTLTPERTVFVSHSDIPDTPTGKERQTPGGSVSITLRFDDGSLSCGLQLPADRGGNRVFALRDSPR